MIFFQPTWNRIHRSPIRMIVFVIGFVLTCTHGNVAVAQSPVASTLVELERFVGRHCADCHQGDAAEAGLDLSSLPQDLSNADNFATWVKVFDRVAAGEMPPKDAEPVPAAESSSFLSDSNSWLTNYQRGIQAHEGRVHGRRLTNYQLERTLQDVLGIDIPLASEMPEEPKTGDFATIAARQSLSHFQLEQHLKVVDLALDEAFRRCQTPSDEKFAHLTAKDISRTQTRTREPEYIDGGAVTWSSALIFYGRLPATIAKQAGWYRFKIRVSTLNTPSEHGVWCTVRSGQCVSSAPLMAWISAFEAMPEAKEVTFDAWLPRGHMLEIRPGDATLKSAKFAGGQSANGEGGPQNVPGIRIDWLEVARIHTGPSDDQIRKRLLGNFPILSHSTYHSPNSPSDKQPEAQSSAAQSPASDIALGKELLRQFATRAFRRPLATDKRSHTNATDADHATSESVELNRFFQIFESSYRHDSDFVVALRAAYRAILCSARFMYFQEQPGPLDDYAIATRLSYLLWNGPPDDELFELAAQGSLRNPSVLQSQISRMLAVPAGNRFIPDFAAQWLELSEIDFTEPDRKLYPDFDIITQYSMLAETHAYLQAMLAEDASVVDFVNGETTFVNSRLARFYNLSCIDAESNPRASDGDVLRRVSLRPEDHRGGLLSQGAILKVTANGTNTSPVVRGVWVSERILGEVIPPPPQAVSAIEPDIRGAKTIREQLEKHRSLAECASCHSKIDPPGFALESFDAAGQWREYYPRVQGGNQKKGLPIDASYTTAAGEPFSGIGEFRKLVAQAPQPLARNFAEELLAYGTGAATTFADRVEVDRIVSAAAEHNYGMRSILDAVITSPIFLSK